MLPAGGSYKAVVCGGFRVNDKVCLLVCSGSKSDLADDFVVDRIKLCVDKYKKIGLASPTGVCEPAIFYVEHTRCDASSKMCEMLRVLGHQNVSRFDDEMTDEQIKTRMKGFESQILLSPFSTGNDRVDLVDMMEGHVEKLRAMRRLIMVLRLDG